jgi:hypothetical protein
MSMIVTWKGVITELYKGRIIKWDIENTGNLPELLRDIGSETVGCEIIEVLVTRVLPDIPVDKNIKELMDRVIQHKKEGIHT